ncbi:RNA polymerase sigma factor [Bacillus sp. ISL-47]|uniref:RNA polymerase sigma factor n=1 Tax=Bacillus sp. ISL-47 TaxID=2819130 RepID=UPI001BECAFE5|nr:RNA polymerase sigma factor [Bacillus sp. ISL-47]MBT2690937.1 RNA polymerase sigma factor [Bacillus sp. ISL-47]MBT2706714.1 RNA polymerase sigma factor [Pseudomonas sp. ISL-84]
MSDSRISEWFYEYSHDIYHFLIYTLGTGDVEDLVQEVFIRAIRNIDSFQERSSPKTWLFGIARHVGIDEIRKRQRERLKNYLFMKSEEASSKDNPEEFLEMSETHQVLYKAVRGLKQSYRDVVILRGIKEMTIGETAEILGWSEGKVRLTFHRAIKALQKEKERFM